MQGFFPVAMRNGECYAGRGMLCGMGNAMREGECYAGSGMLTCFCVVVMQPNMVSKGEWTFVVKKIERWDLFLNTERRKQNGRGNLMAEIPLSEPHQKSELYYRHVSGWWSMKNGGEIVESFFHIGKWNRTYFL